MFSQFFFATFHSFPPWTAIKPYQLLQSEKRHILKALTICGHLVFGPPYDGGRTLLGFYPAGEGHFWAGIGPPPPQFWHSCRKQVGTLTSLLIGDGL